MDVAENTVVRSEASSARFGADNSGDDDSGKMTAGSPWRLKTGRHATSSDYQSGAGIRLWVRSDSQNPLDHALTISLTEQTRGNCMLATLHPTSWKIRIGFPISPCVLVNCRYFGLRAQTRET